MWRTYSSIESNYTLISLLSPLKYNSKAFRLNAIQKSNQNFCNITRITCESESLTKFISFEFLEKTTDWPLLVHFQYRKPSAYLGADRTALRINLGQKTKTFSSRLKLICRSRMKLTSQKAVHREIAHANSKCPLPVNVSTCPWSSVGTKRPINCFCASLQL